MFKTMLRAAFALGLIASAGLAHAEKISQQALDAARTHGKVRVLVMLRDPQPAHAFDTRNNGQTRKQEVALRVGALLERLPATGYALRRRFALVPAIAIEANVAVLERLRDDADVVRIDLDLPGSGNSIAPDEASVLNNVSPLQGLGYAGTGMKVAVIDTGVDTNHVDLQSRLVGQACFCSNSNGIGGCCPNGQATQTGTGAAEDDHGHGTNVSGIMVGMGNAAPRGALPSAQLVVVKAISASNGFCCTSDIVASMDWIASNHPDVDAVNMSLGTNALFAGDCDNVDANTQALAAAVNSLIARGAVVTVSTGNAGNSSMIGAPSCVSTAVSVAATWDSNLGSQTFLGCTDATTAARKPTCFSNRSTTTDIYAAGAYVTATGFTGTTSTFGGTSQASPMVAACAAALKQAAPASTVAQRIEAMKLSSTRVTDPVSGRSYPFLDCVDALHLVAAKKQYADFNGDSKSDVLWRNSTTGVDSIWKSANSATPQAVATISDQSWKVFGIGDFNGDGKADIFWRNAGTGANSIWKSANSNTPQAMTSVSGATWKVGIGDFDGDGKSDILWRSGTSGVNAIWKSGNSATPQTVTAISSQAWKIAGVGDFDGDGKADIFWRNDSSGANTIWRSANSATTLAATAVTLAWKVVGVGDFNGDGKADVLWRNTSTGANAIWRSANSATPQTVTGVSDQAWKVVGIGDYSGDGVADILWRNTSTGVNAIWKSANAATKQTISAIPDLAWSVAP